MARTDGRNSGANRERGIAEGAEAGGATCRAFEQTQIAHGRFVERREGEFLLRPSPARSFSPASTLAGTDAEHVQLRLVIFRSTSDEPTRVHPMQIWQTPFMSDEHAAAAPTTGSYLERVGNSDLVQGISDAFSICQPIWCQAYIKSSRIS